MKQPELLLQYQKIDIKIGKIEGKLKKSAVRSKLMKVRNYLLESQKKMQQYETDAAEIAAFLKNALQLYNAIADTIHEIDTAIENVDASSSIKEAQMLIRKAKQEKGKLDRQEKEIHQIQRKLQQIEESIHKIATNAPRYKTEYNQLKEKYDEELKVISTECTPLKKDLKALEDQIDPNMMKRYNNVKKSHPIAVVRLEGTRCMGCNMEVSSGMARKVVNSDKLVECENCGRLLYTRQES